MVDEEEDSGEGDSPPSYFSVGKTSAEKIRESIVLEDHLKNINRLARENLIVHSNRVRFKFGLKALESYLMPYMDDECKTELENIRKMDMGNNMYEAEKCFLFYSALKGVIARSGLCLRPMNLYSTIED